MRHFAFLVLFAILSLGGCASASYRSMAEGSISVRTDASGRVVYARMVKSIRPDIDAAVTSFALKNWKGPANSARVFVLSFEKLDQPDPAKVRLGDSSFRTTL